MRIGILVVEFDPSGKGGQTGLSTSEPNTSPARRNSASPTAWPSSSFAVFSPFKIGDDDGDWLRPPAFKLVEL